MVRPIRKRFLRGQPGAYYFKPQGIPLRNLEEVVLEADEFEALRLHDYCNLNQIDASGQMEISQPTTSALSAFR